MPRLQIDHYFTSLFVIFKLLGLAPFSVEKPKGAENIQVVYSRLGLVYNSMLTAVLISIGMIGTSTLYNERYVGWTKMYQLLDTALMAFGCANAVLILLMYCIRLKSLISISKDIFKCERMMKTVDNKFRRGPTVGFVLTTCSVTSLLATLVIVITYLGNDHRIIVTLAYILPSLIITWMFLQYAFVARAIFATVRALNEHLSKVKRDDDPGTNPESHLTRWTLNARGSRELYTLRELHSSLCKLVDDVSSFYSLPTLFCIVYLMYCFVFFSYYMISYYTADSMERIILLMDCGVSIIYYASTLVILTSSANATITEVISIDELLEF